MSARNLLPVAVAALWLVHAAPHDRVRDAEAFGMPGSILHAELRRCMANGRDADACLDEADGEARVERAEWLARNDDPSRRASR